MCPGLCIALALVVALAMAMAVGMDWLLGVRGYFDGGEIVNHGDDTLCTRGE